MDLQQQATSSNYWRNDGNEQNHLSCPESSTDQNTMAPPMKSLEQMRDAIDVIIGKLDERILLTESTLNN